MQLVVYNVVETELFGVVALGVPVLVAVSAGDEVAGSAVDVGSYPRMFGTM